MSEAWGTESLAELLETAYKVDPTTPPLPDALPGVRLAR
jgi:hypothetical protein